MAPIKIFGDTWNSLLCTDEAGFSIFHFAFNIGVLLLGRYSRIIGKILHNIDIIISKIENQKNMKKYEKYEKCHIWELFRILFSTTFIFMSHRSDGFHFFVNQVNQWFKKKKMQYQVNYFRAQKSRLQKKTINGLWV